MRTVTEIESLIEQLPTHQMLELALWLGESRRMASGWASAQKLASRSPAHPISLTTQTALWPSDTSRAGKGTLRRGQEITRGDCNCPDSACMPKGRARLQWARADGRYRVQIEVAR